MMRSTIKTMFVLGAMAAVSGMLPMSSAQTAPGQTPSLPPSVPQQPPTTPKPPPPGPELQDTLDRFAEIVADTIARSHGVATWRQKNTIQADLTIEPPGKTPIECTLSQEVHRGRTRIDFKSGVTVVQDGETIWISPADATLPDAIVELTSFGDLVSAPFHLRDRGAKPSAYKAAPVRGQPHDSIKITYSEHANKSAGEWRTIFSKPKTHLLYAVANVPSAANAGEADDAQRLCVIFEDNQPIEGVQFATQWTIWKWDSDVDGAPIGKVTLSNLKFIVPPDQFFAEPKSSRAANE